MGQGIQDFYSTAQTYGFARDFQLRVTVLGDLFQSPNDSLFVYARSTTVPSRKIETKEVAFKGFKYNIPMQSVYDSGNWSLTLYCDQAMQIRKEFELWQARVFNEHTMQGTLENKIVQLNLLNDNTDTIMIYRLHGVTPLSIGEIKYDLGGQGAPQSLDIILAYQYWTSQEVQAINNSENLDLLSRITNVVRGIGGFTQSVNNGVRSVRNLSSIIKG